MKFTIQEERSVKSLKDLQVLRTSLIQQSEAKEEKIKRRFDKITTQTHIQDVYYDVLKRFNLQHSLMNMLPMFLKYKDYILNSKVADNVKKTVTKPKFILWGTFAGMFSTFLYFRTRKRN